MSRPWYDPDPVYEDHGRFVVVRDDLVPGGSKQRFLPHLVQGAREVVFGGPFCGGAPLALSVYGKREGVKVTLFYAKRKELHARQKLAQENGAQIVQVPHGYMNVVQKAARDYCARTGALFLPLGFDKPEASLPFIEAMRRVRSQVGQIDEVWCATGSGMLARCLGVAFAGIPVRGVVVGLHSRNEKQRYTGNVSLLESPYQFARETKATSPFPSCGNYDRKAWEMAQEKARGKRILFWNVLG